VIKVFHRQKRLVSFQKEQFQ